MDQIFIDDLTNSPFKNITLDTSLGEIIYDDKPVLEYLNSKTILDWRQTMIQR